jgi:hypothetical protein
MTHQEHSRKHTTERLDYIRQVYKEGVSYKDMGKHLGITRECVGGLIHRMGLHDRRSPVDRLGRTLGRIPVDKPHPGVRVVTVTLASIPPPRS